MFRKIRNRLSHYTWALAYGKYDESIIKSDIFSNGGLHYVNNPYKNKWFADPFILDDTRDYLSLLVEEFDSGIKKGRIARIKINKKTDTIEECSILLELPTHLSFPAIYRLNDSIYVHPENSASGASTIYKYDRVSEHLVNPIVLINRPLTDAIIEYKNGKYYMYATEYPHSCENILIEYQSDEFLGTYVKNKEIEYPGRTARMAGDFISYHGVQLRPAQDCNHDYGEAVLFYKETELFSELRPKGVIYEGLHTFNHYKDSFVVDLKIYNFPIIHSTIKRLLNFIR